MKKVGIFIIVLVVILAIILNGYLIIDNTEKVKDEEKLLNDFDEEVEVFCEIEDIFKCDIFNYSVYQGKVELKLTNLGKEDFLVKSFEIENCIDNQTNSITIILNKSNNFEFTCPVIENQLFMEEIEIRYKRVYGPGQTKILSGSFVQREKR